MHLYRPLVIALLSAGLLHGCGGDDAPTVDQQAAALLAKMTLDEKIQLVHGEGYGVPDALGGAGVVKGIPRLGIPNLTNADSAGGVNVVGSNATPYPAPIALAASWDPTLAHSYGSAIATELRALGFAEGLGGGVNLAREPRNGRTFEYMGEDPVLAGNMITQRTLGTQSQKVIATIKHFAGNEQETNRFTSNSVIDERTLRELYLLPFEMGVKDGAPGNVMCAYNLLNGVKACESAYLLTDVLKTEWGFKGIVQSDWFFAVTDTVRAANAGLDEEEAGSADDYTPTSFGSFALPATSFNQKLKAAVQAGTVPLARLDDMVLRKLRTLYASGVMASPPKAGGTVDQAAGNAVAQKVAEQSMVLLKNAVASGDAANVLPLSTTAAQTIVVIGGHADAGVISGGGSGAVPARDGNAVTCLVPNTSTFGSCAVWYKSAPLAAIRAMAPNATVTYLDGSDPAAAASAAAAADVAIVFATQWQTEGVDLPNLSLPNNAADPANQAYDQNALITAVAAAAKRSVVVLETGTAVTMPWLANVNAVVEAWYPGVQGGPAIANVLFGAVNPSGKLPLTFPQSESDLLQASISATDLTVNYSEGLKMGYRWYDAQNITPLFPFGHGLSYTSFSYTGISTRSNSDGSVTVGFTLKNTGARAGAEVAQVYAGLPAEAGEPPKRLVAWEKVQLAAGESKAVSITVKPERLSIWNATTHRWQTPSGSYSFVVGGSSRDSAQSAVLVRS